MKIKNLKLSIGLAIFAVMAVSLVSYYLYQNNEKEIVIKPSYTETSYVEANLGAGALMKIKNPKYTAEIVNTSDIIIKGEISSSDIETKTIELKEGTPERAIADKRGDPSTSEVRGTNLSVKVLETLKEDKLPENVTVYIPDIYKYLVPNLQENNMYIFCLNYNNDLGKYIFCHPSASFYQVEKDGKIKSFYDQTSDFYDFTGKPYDKFKTKLLKEIDEGKK